MAGGNINYKAVLADLEARKAQIESAIAAVKSFLTSGAGDSGDGGVTDVSSAEDIPRGAFLRLSIADATKKFLDMVRTKQSTLQITQALERGGLPPPKTNTVYSVLRRRENDIGDIIRFGDDWALGEWYPNLRKAKPKSARKRAKAKKKVAGPVGSASRVVPADAEEAPKPARKISKGDAIEEVLKAAGDQAVHAKTIAETLNRDYGKNDTNRTVAATMHQDPKKRFVNLGDNMWVLAEK